MARKQNFKSNGHFEPLPERGPSMLKEGKFIIIFLKEEGDEEDGGAQPPLVALFSLGEECRKTV